ncbi:MAG TPA: GNAT family N-acetyltransferase, partial [Symbiobacteriaceae bacterium]|nr:GNAT family N-acetyltransferase [Symbiobacteriaceae bacterium]
MPLVQAHPGQEPEILAQLTAEPFFNLFLIANLAEGLSPDLEVWTDGHGSVLMRRRVNWVIAAGPAFDPAATAAIIDGYSPEMARGMVGRPEAVDPVYAALHNHKGTLFQQLFAALKSVPEPTPYVGLPRPARPEDLDALTAIYADAGTMSRSRGMLEQSLPTFWVVEDQGRVVCAGSVLSRSSQAGMVGAIFTPPELRGKGYASTIVHAVSTALLQEGRTPCLFYHNPDAGRIYRRLGYTE